MTDYLPDKPYFRLDEVARLFDVSRSTLYRWIEEGRLPSVKIAGKAVRIEREALLKIIEDN